ncbi:Calmodulin [Diplonema papillatum]|nr:Calmodulin [Diplonema papillatum]
MESRPEEGLLKEQQEREFQEACEMYDIDGNGTVPLSSISCVLGSLGLCLADSMIAQFREKKAEEGESEVSYSELQHLVDKMQTIEDAQAAASKSKAAELENIFHLWDPSGAGIVKSSDASTNALSKALSEVMPVADVDAMLTKYRDDKGNLQYLDLCQDITS